VQFSQAARQSLKQGIKRRLTVLAWTCLDATRHDSRTRSSDALVPPSVLACHRSPRLSCQISCQTRDGVSAYKAKINSLDLMGVPIAEHAANRLATLSIRPPSSRGGS
jgi:hypothetical protein